MIIKSLSITVVNIITESHKHTFNRWPDWNKIEKKQKIIDNNYGQ